MKKAIFIIAIYCLCGLDKGYTQDTPKLLIDVEPRLVSTKPGTTHTLTVTNKSNSAISFKLGVSGLPNGVKVTAHGAPLDQVVLSGENPFFNLKIFTEKDLSPGSYRFFITAKNRSKSRNITVIGVPVQLYVFNSSQTIVPVNIFDNAIRGIVFDDRNENGSIDPGEAVSDAVVRVAGSGLTSTTDIGGYFYMIKDPKSNHRADNIQLEVTLNP